MRAEAQGLSSAANSDGSAIRGSVFGRRDNATRASSLSLDGSGAPSHRGRLTILALAIAAFALLAFAPFSQAKVIVSGFGTSAGSTAGASDPPLGGQIQNPNGVAVNTSGAGGVARGTVYVVDGNLDTGTPERVQRFSPLGDFERLWGENVFGRDERQRITLSGVTGGRFTLSFGPDSIEFTVGKSSGSGIVDLPSGGTVRSALEAIPSIGGGNVIVDGSPASSFTVRFIRSLGGTDVPQINVDGSQLSGTPPISASVSTIENGFGGTFAGFEICTVASQCKPGLGTFGGADEKGAATANGGQLGQPTGIAVNQSTGHVYVTESGNRRVSEFDADGNFVRTWGWDVVLSGRPEDVSANAFEICTVPADCKQAAAAGADGGRFASDGGINPLGHPAIDSSGNVWVPDPTNRRIQQFTSTGNFIAAYGWNVDRLGGAGALEVCVSAAPGACQAGTQGSTLGQFSASNPRRIAFDSSGNIYAIDAGNNRVQKFNPAFTSATNFGAGVFPAFTTAAPEGVVATQGGNRLTFALLNNVSASPSERQLVELDLAENVRDTSLVGTRLNGAINGLAEDSSTGNLYATTTASISPRRVLVLNSTPLAAPVPAMDPVTVKASTTATFSGTVDPRGGWVECKFQYSTDQRTWTDVTAPACDSLSFGAGAQAIRADVSGLSTNTQYFARLVIARPLDPSSTRTTLAKTFSTDHVAPTVSNVGVVEIADVSARMVGTINPNNSATAYVFQYGTTPALGSSTDPVDIGGGSRTLIVSQLIKGLRPATTYYFKLVATNLAGSASNTSQTFTTRTDPLPLPDGRRYEQVSPVDKNFGGVDFTTFPTSSAAPDGQAVAYCAGSGQPDDQVAGPCANYVSRRAAGGWETGPLNPPICSSGNIFQGLVSIPSLNLDHAVFLLPLQEDYCPTTPLDPAQPVAAGDSLASALYRENLLDDPRTYDLVSPRALNANNGFYVSTSDDAGHLVFPDSGQHTLDAPAGNFRKLYDWHNGDLSLVSKDPAEQPLSANASVPDNAVNGVSASGARIFFQSPLAVTEGNSADCFFDINCELYMREDAERTAWVSEQECSVACTDTDTRDFFEWASLDGSRAIFRSEGRLTDTDTQSGRDLYLYTHTANPSSDRNLTFLSKDEEPSDGSGGDIRGVLGISDDADVVYFVANGQLVLGGPTAAGPKLYRWSFHGGSPTIDYLATLDASDGAGITLWESFPKTYPAMRLVSPDGVHLLVQVDAKLDPVADQDSDRDVYRWSEADGWICASCQTPGSPSAGDASIEGTTVHGILANPGTVNTEQRIVMNDDGERIFFTTPDALASGDVNGRIGDVYEWHDDAVHLISGGNAAKEALLIGTSHSGSDVLFITFERLVGWDIDKATDIYDARIGGGFPEPPTIGVPCEGEACRGAGSVAPVVTGAGTRVFEGQADPDPRRTQRRPSRCPRGKRKVTRNGRTRCVKRQRRNANDNRRTAR